MMKLLTCVIPGGPFEKNQIYPFYWINGYAYIVVVDSVSQSPKFIPMDSFEDETFKIVGNWNDLEDAKFKEVKFNGNT